MEELPPVPVKSYSDVRHHIKSGDILLCSGASTFSKMIQRATNSMWSHVAFILRLDVIDRIMVLESVESIGVRAVTLSSYLWDYNATGKAYPGKLLVARHHDAISDHIPHLSKFATDLLGYPYNTEQILRIAARISMNNIGLQVPASDPPSTREFICSEYAYACLKSIGILIDYDPLGFIAPVDFARSPKVSPLYFIQGDRSKEATRVAEKHLGETQRERATA
jgi:hypothetical protein